MKVVVPGILIAGRFIVLVGGHAIAVPGSLHGQRNPMYTAKIEFMGQINLQYTVGLDRMAIYLIYGDSQPIATGDLAISNFLEDLTGDDMLLNMSEEMIAEAASILETFEAIEATGSPQEAPPTTGNSAIDFTSLHPEWSFYKNADYGFTLCHPPELSLAEKPHRMLQEGEGRIPDGIGHL